MTERHRFRDWDAAYLLDSLSADDRRSYEVHLVECAECSTGVAELAVLPGLLGRLGAAEAVALLDGPVARGTAVVTHGGEVRRLARRLRSRRRRLRALAIAGGSGAAVALVASGILLGPALVPAPQPVAVPSATASPGASESSGSSGTGVTSLALAPRGGTGVEAEVVLTEKRWGTRFDWTCDYGAAAASASDAADYSMVVTDAAGIETTVATWTSTGSPTAGGLAASASVPTSTIRSVEIRDSSNVTLASGGF